MRCYFSCTLLTAGRIICFGSHLPSALWIRRVPENASLIVIWFDKWNGSPSNEIKIALKPRPDAFTSKFDRNLIRRGFLFTFASSLFIIFFSPFSFRYSSRRKVSLSDFSQAHVALFVNFYNKNTFIFKSFIL